MKAVHVISGTGAAAEALRRRHRPDHPGRVAQARRAHRLRAGAVRHVAGRPRLRAQRRALRRRVDDRRRAGVRRRVLTRARRLGDPAVRLRRRHRAELLGHLPQQLHEERPRTGRRPEARRRADLGGHRRRPGDRDHRRRRAARRRGAGDRARRAVPDGPRRPRTASSTASTTSASRSARRRSIDAFEATTARLAAALTRADRHRPPGAGTRSTSGPSRRRVGDLFARRRADDRRRRGDRPAAAQTNVPLATLPSSSAPSNDPTTRPRRRPSRARVARRQPARRRRSPASLVLARPSPARRCAAPPTRAGRRSPGAGGRSTDTEPSRSPPSSARARRVEAQRVERHRGVPTPGRG